MGAVRHPLILAIVLACLPLCGHAQTPVVVGFKSFTESVILGEIATQLNRDEGGTCPKPA